MRPFTQIKGTEAIKKQINLSYAQGKKWENMVQNIALSIVQHVNEHHETSLINLHIEKMPKGARVNALRQWYCNHAKAVWNEDTEQFDQVKAEPKDFKAAQEQHWTECKPEKGFRPLDLQAAIDSLFAKAKAAVESDKADQHKIDKAQLAALSQLATVK